MRYNKHRMKNPKINRRLLEELKSIQDPTNPMGSFIKQSLDQIEHQLKTEKPTPEFCETLRTYWIPIADHFGMWKMRYRIEDALFKYMDPQNYDLIESLVKKKTRVHQQLLKEIAGLLRYHLKKSGIKGSSILFRKKNLYGVFTKMRRKKKTINHLDDFFAIRIVIKNIPDCYKILAVLHALWPPYQHRLKDYIKHPKPNGYQSLHTTLHCLKGYAVEFQIRTKEMDKIAKYGLAAHSHYKESLGRTSS